MFGGTWRLPVRTLWQRDSGIDPEAMSSEMERGTLRFTFGGFGIPMPNVLDGDRMDYGNTFEAAGYHIVIRYIEYKDQDGGVYHCYVDVTKLPPDNPVPLIPIIAGLAAALGLGIIGLLLLSKVEAILEVPTLPVLGILGLLFYKASKGAK